MTTEPAVERRPVIVQKYGGSSLATAEHIHNVAARIQARKDDGVDVIVVVSAMGDSTDDLIALSEAVTHGQTPDAREMDTLLSTGELVSSRHCRCASLVQAALLPPPLPRFARFSVEFRLLVANLS